MHLIQADRETTSHNPQQGREFDRWGNIEAIPYKTQFWCFLLPMALLV
jgi:hypothetical protein